MLMLDLLVADATPVQLAQSKIAELEARKQDDPLVQHDVIAREDGSAVLLDFVLSAPDADGGLIVEWNAYRYERVADGVLLSSYVDGNATRQGIAIGGSSGQPVVAAADGVVVYSGAGLVGYGELIIVKHNEQWLSAYGHNHIAPVVAKLAAAGVRVSCFIDADPAQAAAAKAMGAQVVEFHTGAYCDAVRERSPQAPALLEALRAAAGCGCARAGRRKTPAAGPIRSSSPRSRIR